MNIRYPLYEGVYRILTLNGTEYKKNYLRHEDLLKGGNINFQMGSQPNLNRGTEEESFPYSFSKVLKKIR